MAVFRPINPAIRKPFNSLVAHGKNPITARRSLGPAYDPVIQADVEQLSRAQQAFKGRTGTYQVPKVPPPEQIQPSRVWPIRLLQTAYLAVATAKYALVIPRNPQRLSLLLGNPSTSSNEIYFTFGPGTISGYYGFPLAPGAIYNEQGNYISIDDIYVICPTATVEVLWYEGTAFQDQG